jgi:hypothetical protein
MAWLAQELKGEPSAGNWLRKSLSLPGNDFGKQFDRKQ